MSTTRASPAASGAIRTRTAAGRADAAPSAGSFHVAPSRIAPGAGIGNARLTTGREHERRPERISIDRRRLAGLEAALDQGPREGVLDEPLDRPLEGPRPIGRVGALAGDERSRRGRE